MIISPVVAYRQVSDGPNAVRLACVSCFDPDCPAPMAGDWEPVHGWEVECPGEHGADSACFCGEPARCGFCQEVIA